MTNSKRTTCRVLPLTTLNEWARDENAFIQNAETEHRNFIKRVCDGVVEDDIRIIMVAGPSSSGKTTSAYQVAEELMNKGRPAVVISLDDFYLGEKKAPLLPDGTHDLETIHALNISQIRNSLRELFETGQCKTPIFDFTRGCPSSETRQISLPEGTLIMEGLHSVNPLITDGFEKKMRKVYVNVNTDIRDGDEILLTHGEIRLVRRIVRDVRTRNASPERTMNMWNNIQRGERLYIDVFEDDCDVIMDTFMEYELNLMAACGLPVVRELLKSETYRSQGERLVNALEKFTLISGKSVPQNSLIREFIG